MKPKDSHSSLRLKGTSLSSSPSRSSKVTEKAFSLNPVEEISRIFGYEFKNSTLLEEALTHRSVVDLNVDKRSHYERLEFIGDAVLGLGVSKILYAEYPEESEGQLSRLRAAAVRSTTLSQIARKLGLGSLIKMSRSEVETGGREKDSILADIVESILGAIFIDSDFDTVFRVISEIFSGTLEKLDSKDPKTDLQELLHTLGLGAPSYQIESTLGPDHAPSFISVVLIDGEIFGRGQGRSKKVAQQSAAEEALRKLRLNQT